MIFFAFRNYYEQLNHGFLRIYRKKRLIVQCDVKEGQLNKRDVKYDLSLAKEDFNLWDGVHGREVIKHLEQFSKWEPGKKEREKREKAALMAAMEAQQAMENEDGLEGTSTTISTDFAC